MNLNISNKLNLKMLSRKQEISMITKKKLAKLLIHNGESEMQIEFSR